MIREPAWRREGEEPSYRFSLANERTFLAWIRTPPAVLAGGVVLEQFAARLHPRLLVSSIAVAMCVLAAAICMMAYRHWRANEIAMRHKRRLPSTLALAAIAAGLSIAAALVIVLLLWSSAGRGNTARPQLPILVCSLNGLAWPGAAPRSCFFATRF